MDIQEGDVLEICLEKYGKITAYIVESIKNTMRDGKYPEIRNSKYIVVRKLESKDKLIETTNKDGLIVFKLTKGSGI